LRFDIENWMTSRIAFQLERSGLRHRQALGRLMLVLAVATLFLDLQGTALVHSNRRWLIPSSGLELSQTRLEMGQQCLARAQSFFPL